MVALVILGVWGATPVGALGARPGPGARAQAEPADGTGPGEPGRSDEGPGLRLVDQAPYVAPGDDFRLRLRPDPAVLGPDTEVAVTVYGAVGSRSEYVLTLADRITTRPVGPPARVPVGPALDEDGTLTVTVGLRALPPAGGSAPGPAATDPARLDLGRRDGVFPVRVVLEAPGAGVLDRFVTHLTYLAEERVGTKLATALVLPVDGSAADPEPVASLASALAGRPDVPLTLAPSPAMLASLAENRPDLLTELRTAASGGAGVDPAPSGRSVLTRPYADVDAAALVAVGLDGELARQLAAGRDVTDRQLPATPEPGTWLASAPLTPAGLEALTTQGVERLVVGEDSLVPIDQRLSTSRPFLVSAGSDHGDPVPAVLADAGLAAHFQSVRDPALAAYQLLADLAVLFLDEPGTDQRGVVVAPPSGWRPSAAMLEPLLAGIADHPVLRAVPVGTLLANPAGEVTRTGAPLVRELAAAEPDPAAVTSLGAVADEVRAVRRDLASLDTVVVEPSPDAPDLATQVLRAEAAGLDPEQARHHLAEARAGIEAALSAIRMPEDQSITITAREAEIPLTLQNRTGTPARVVLRVASDKLTFPMGESRLVELDRLNTTERVPVVARTSGAFPLVVTLQSPDGNLVLGQVRLTVNSTAASRLSVIVSVGAAGFLALWWGRQIVRDRRRRRSGA